MIKMTCLQKEEKHICEEDKATSGNSGLFFFFFKKGSKRTFSYSTPSVPIFEALILLISHPSQDQERWTENFFLTIF